MPASVAHAPTHASPPVRACWSGRARTSGLTALVLAVALVAAACGADPDEEITADRQTTVAPAALGEESTSTTARVISTPAPGSASTPPSAADPTGETDEQPTAGSSTTIVATTSPPASTASNAPAGLDCTTACNLVFEGDSLIHSFVDTLCVELATLGCANSGLVGHRVDQMVMTAPADVDNLVGTDANDVLVLWGGTNDLWQDFNSPDPNENAARTYDWISTYVAERRAIGWDYIFVMTLPPANPDIIQGDARLNELIRQNSAGADAVIDVAAEPKLADPFDPVLKAVDGIHYTDPGRWLVLYDHLVPAIEGLAG